MPFRFLTLDDVQTEGKRVFLRVDINSPIDPESGRLLSDVRIRSILDTLRDLKGAKVVMTSHQGRPGREDFTSLALHVERLRNYCDRPVKFVQDVIGPTAIRAIKTLQEGEILVLENVRFCSEEMIRAPPRELVKTHLVRKLAPLFDLFVNDAFAAAHRSQPSLVGFSELLLMVAGRVMEEELRVLNRMLERPLVPATIVLGGSKVSDKVPAVRLLLKRGVADVVLVGGLVGLTFLKASGCWLGEETEAMLNPDLVEEAKATLTKFRDKIVMPVDAAWEEAEGRLEEELSKLRNPGQIADIGSATCDLFERYITQARTVVVLGPMGRFERPGFQVGTERVLNAVLRSKAFTIVGGGHITSLVEEMGVSEELDHVSTGGGALLYVLSGREMPVLRALSRSARAVKKAEMSFI